MCAALHTSWPDRCSAVRKLTYAACCRRSTSKWSRIRYKDLKPMLPSLRREGTAWMPHSVKIERSGIYNFRELQSSFELASGPFLPYIL